MFEKRKENYSPIRILSIHWGFSLGGVGKYAQLINRVTQYSPIDIKSVCILNDRWQCDLQGLQQLDAEKISIRSRFDFSWIGNILETVNKIKPNFIMTHGFNGHFVSMLTRVLTKHQIPLICSYHGSYHATSKNRYLVGTFFNRFTEYFIREKVLAAISVAKFSKNYLVQKGIAADKIEVIHNGIDDSVASVDAREMLRNAWGVENNEVLIGVASRLDPVKGISYLIDAMKQLQKPYPHVKLVIVGTGTCEDQLKKQVEDLDLSDSVSFLGFRSDVPICMAAFDIFAIPSLHEYHSIALLEAMRAGKAIVATDVGGNTESARPNKEALIVPPANRDALADALTELLVDGSLCNSLGKAAHQRFQNHFTVDVMVKHTAEWMIKCGRLSKERNR